MKALRLSVITTKKAVTTTASPATETMTTAAGVSTPEIRVTFQLPGSSDE